MANEIARRLPASAIAKTAAMDLALAASRQSEMTGKHADERLKSFRRPAPRFA